MNKYCFERAYILSQWFFNFTIVQPNACFLSFYFVASLVQLAVKLLLKCMHGVAPVFIAVYIWDTAPISIATAEIDSLSSSVGRLIVK